MKNKLKTNLFSAVVTSAVIAVIVLVNVVLYSLTEINEWYFAYTESIDFSISGNTDDLFAEAEREGRKVKIIFCMPEDDLEAHMTGADVLKTAKQLEERHPDFIDLVFYNIKTQKDEDGNLVDFTKYMTDGRGNEVKLHSGAVIFSTTVSDGVGGVREDFKVLNAQYNGIPYVDFYHIDTEGYITAYMGEEVMASSILWTFADEHKVAYFTNGHGESVDLAFAAMLTKAGYYIEQLDLLRGGIPASEAGLIVISNPTADFAKGKDGVYSEIEKLSAYLETNGGALYVSLDPYANPLPNLEELISEYGIKVASGKNGEGKTVRRIIKDSRNAIYPDGYTFVANYADNAIGEALKSKTEKYVNDDVVVKDVGELVLSGGAKEVLVTSSSASSMLDGEGESGKFCIAAISKKASKNGGEARVFVTSGIYLTASDAITRDSYANRSFLYALLEQEFDSSIAPYGCRTVPYIEAILEDLTMGTARIYTVLVMSVPAILAVLAIVINKRRKNR